MSQQTARAWLVLGFSGSGKTEYVKQRIRKLKQPLILIHGGGDEEAEYSEFQPTKMELHEDLKGLKKVTIVVEDFVRQSDKETKVLLKMLGYLKRHNCCNIFLNTYMLSSTGATTLLNLFDRVVFTSHPSNLRSINNFLRLCPLEAPQEKMARTFLTGRTRYMEVDMRKQTVSYLDDCLSKKREERTPTFQDCRGHLLELLGNFDESDMLAALLSFMERNVDLDSLVDPSDFTITLRVKRKKIVVSLIDFLVSLRSEERPPKNVTILFRFFSSQFRFPMSFIANDILRRGNEK